MKSNINITSNIYVRTDDAISYDKAFLKQVRGRTALLGLYPTNASNNNLTKSQLAQCDMPTVCSHTCNKNNHQTHGIIVVDDQNEWSCRCEHTECSEYTTCMIDPYAKIIKRDEKSQEITQETDEIEKEELNFEYLDIDANGNKIDNIFSLPNENSTQNLTQDTTQNITQEIEPIKQTILTNTFEKLEDYSPTIESEITQKIFVNSAPGTGKTYTVIKRLEHIILNNLVDDFESILVLCFNQSSQKIIKNEILKKIESGEYPSTAKNINIFKINTFVSNYLIDISYDKFKAMTQNEQIEYYINLCNKNNLSKFQYLIIDELQDIVNYRAFIVLNILDSIDCGYLLLGDNCQSIYDYSSSDYQKFSMNSIEFYKTLYQYLSADVKRYELVNNIRQIDNEILSNISFNIRDALLQNNDENIKNTIEKELNAFDVQNTDVDKFIPAIDENKSVVILCRNNGEVEWVSSALHRNKVNHILSKDENAKEFSKSIALVLWDYCNEIIEQDVFLMRYMDRVNDDKTEALNLYTALLKFSKNDELYKVENHINKSELLQAMFTKNDIPIELSANKNCNITLSTIHKSKGQEFDVVYLSVGKPTELTEENRITYVAITRAKTELKLVKFKKTLRFSYPKSNSMRVANLNWAYGSCQGISIGNDVDNKSLITGDYFQVLSTQEYINNNISIHDNVELILENGKYVIYHVKLVDGVKTHQNIGNISQFAFNDIRSIVNYKSNSYGKMPKRIYNIYISNIITIPHFTTQNAPTQFDESKFSLGVKISGLADLEWN